MLHETVTFTTKCMEMTLYLSRPGQIAWHFIFVKERREQEERARGRSVITPDLRRKKWAGISRVLRRFSPRRLPSSRATPIYLALVTDTLVVPLSRVRRVSRRGPRSDDRVPERVMRVRDGISHHPRVVLSDVRIIRCMARRISPEKLATKLRLLSSAIAQPGFWHSRSVHPSRPRASLRGLHRCCSISIWLPELHREKKRERESFSVPISLDSPRRSAGN